MTTVPNLNPSTEVAPAPRRPWGERVNVRLVAFVLVVSLPFVWIIGSAVMHSLNHGITDHGDFKDVDLKSLGNFSFDDVSGTEAQIPKDFLALNGQRVRLTGFIFQPQRTEGSDWRFQFVYDVNKCCFNGPPQVQERVFAYAKGEPPEVSGLAEVFGNLNVRLIRSPDSGKVTSVFDLDVESVKPVQG